MVVVPNMRPYFSNVAEMSGSHMQDISYQVKSFSFFNRFYNIPETMLLIVEVYATL
jgi:hypothetical protein